MDNNINKVVYIRKTNFVREGGRRFRFTSYSIVSNGNNRIGFAYSKSNNISDSTIKSFISANKRVFKFKIKNNTFPRPCTIKFSKTIINMIPTFDNVGIVAGGNIRKILFATGIKNVICKIYGSKNKFNVIKATEKLLYNFKID